MRRPDAQLSVGKHPHTCLRTSKACRTPSYPSSFRENETRLRPTALLQYVRNGSRCESILKPMLATLSKNSDLERGKTLMYKLSARQILFIALISGIFAAGLVVVFDRVYNRF